MQSMPHADVNSYSVNFTLCDAISVDTERWSLPQQRVKVLREHRINSGGHRNVFIGELFEGGAWNRVAVIETDLLSAPDGTYDAAMREVTVLSRIAQSVGPGVVEFKGYVHVPRTAFWIVTELPAGDLLAWMRESGGSLDVPGAVLMAIQLSDTLSRLHAIAVEHGAVSPRNVVRSCMGLVKLAGCGASHQPRVDGDADFCAPEQAAGEAPSDRSDVWALAALTLYAITGELVYPEGAAGGLREAPEMPVAPPLPPRLTVLLLECFSQDPFARPSAADVKRRLVEIQGGAAAPPAAPARVPTAPPPPPALAAQVAPIERQLSAQPQSTTAQITCVEDLAALATTELSGTVIDLKGRHLESDGSYCHPGERVDELFCLRLCGRGTTISNVTLTLPRDVVLLIDAERVALINVKFVVAGELGRVAACVRCAGAECRATLTSCTLQRCRVEVVGAARALLSVCRVEDARQDAVAVRDGGCATLQSCVLSGAWLSALVVTGADSTVEAEGCEFQRPKKCGIHVLDGARATLRDCDVAEAEADGLRVSGDHSVAAATGCRFLAPKSSGVAVDTGASVTLARCTCTDAGKSALTVGRLAVVAATDCTFTGSEASVVNVWGAATAKLSNCFASGSRKSYGLHVKGARTELDAVGCTVADNQLCGVLVCDGAAAQLRDCIASGARKINGLCVQDEGSSVVATGCKFVDNAVCAVGVVDGASARLTSCVGSRSRSTDGLCVAGEHSMAECNDCSFADNQRCAVFLAAGGRADLRDCECSGSKTMGGIWVQNAGSSMVACGCRVTGNWLAGVKVAVGATADLADCKVTDSKESHALEVMGAGSSVTALRCTFNNVFKQCGVSVERGCKAVVKLCVCAIPKNHKNCPCAAPAGEAKSRLRRFF